MARCKFSKSTIERTIKLTAHSTCQNNLVNQLGGSGCCGNDATIFAVYINPTLLGCNIVSAPGTSIDATSNAVYTKPPGVIGNYLAKTTTLAGLAASSTVVQTSPPSVPTDIAPYNGFLGCFEELGSRIVEGNYLYDNTKMTVSLCFDYCGSSGSTYASVIRLGLGL